VLNRRAAQADATVFVADATNPETWACRVNADLYPMNKVDLQHSDLPDHFITISAASGEGLESLKQELAAILGEIEMADESMLVTRERHRQSLSEALLYIETGMQTLHVEAQLEITAMQWRRAWTALGGILGIGDVEHILDQVFSEFCIGK